MGSTAANSYAQSQAQGARDDALAAERIRQRKYDQEAQAINTGARKRYDGFTDQMGERAGSLGDYFAGQKIAQGSANEQAAADMASSQMPASASGVTVAEEGKQRAQATNFTEAQGQALGNLRSFGDLLGDIGRSTSRDAGTIGQISGFKQGSSGVLPYELEAASKEGSGARTLGDVLGLAGTAITGAALSGAIRPEVIAGLFDPAVKVVGKGVVPASGPAAFTKVGGQYTAAPPGLAYRIY